MMEGRGTIPCTTDCHLRCGNICTMAPDKGPCPVEPDGCCWLLAELQGAREGAKRRAEALNSEIERRLAVHGDDGSWVSKSGEFGPAHWRLVPEPVEALPCGLTAGFAKATREPTGTTGTFAPDGGAP